MLDFKDDKLYDSGKVVDGNEFHSWEALGMKDEVLGMKDKDSTLQLLLLQKLKLF